MLIIEITTNHKLVLILAETYNSMKYKTDFYSISIPGSRFNVCYDFLGSGMERKTMGCE